MSQARRLGGAVLVFSLTVAGALIPATAVAAPPSNDDFADAKVLSGDLPIVFTDRSDGSTKEKGEPGVGSTVWYRWTAPRTQRVAIDMCGGESYPPIGSAFTGTSVSALKRVPRTREYAYGNICPLDDPGLDDPSDRNEMHVFQAKAGTTYRIQVLESVAYGPFGFVLQEEEIYDLAISVSVSRKTVPLGGSVREIMKVTNRGNIKTKLRYSFGQELNRPGQPNYPGKGVYASVKSPGGNCAHGTFGYGSKLQTFACDTTPLAPGKSQKVVIKIKNIRSNLMLDAGGFYSQDGTLFDYRPKNDEVQPIIRVQG